MLAPTLDAAPVPTLANMSGDALAPASDAAEVPAKLDDSMLTEEEKKMVEKLAADQRATTPRWCCSTAPAPKKMADFSDTALESVRTKRLARSVAFFSDAVTELRSFDATEEKRACSASSRKAPTKSNRCAPATTRPRPTSTKS